MSKNKSTVPIGTVLEGKLRLVREIGRGGMAAVYEAENIDIGKRVAVKVLATELITSRVVRERFIREARAAAAIRSPYICDVYDCGMYEERPFLVMELLEGESLYELMSRQRQLTPELTLHIARQAARGLQKAHDSGIIHRDLKPENIFLTKGEEGELVAKILDFGLARFYQPVGGDREATRLTREGALFGTPAYMSPEQSKGQGGADHRCDLWALGCIVYECLTGQTVWNIDDGVAMIFAQIAGAPIPRASRLRPDLGPAFDRWFSRALDRDPEQRFQTARQFADELAEALEAPGSLATPVPAVSHVARDVDELLSRPVLAPAVALPLEPLGAPLALPGGPVKRAEQATNPGAAPESSVPPAGARRRSSAGRAVGVLIGVATLALGGYAVWLYGIYPPGRAGVLLPSLERSGTTAQPEAGEAEPYALQIGAAQGWLERGDIANAQSMFNEAFQNGGSAVARSLLSHAKSLGDGTNGTCKVTGLGRPRPFDRVRPTSRPSVAVTPTGAVAAWVDPIDAGQQVQTVLLDSALRRTGGAESITPDARAARQPHLFLHDGGLGVAYWDQGGDEAGLWVRRLSAEGKTEGAAEQLAPGRHQFDVALVRWGRGFWAVWEEQIEPHRTDLVARPLDANLKPTRAAARLASLYRYGTNIEAFASRPDVAVVAGQLNVVFTANRAAANHQVMLLRVRLDDSSLERGLPDVAPAVPPGLPGDEEGSATAPAASSSVKAPRAVPGPSSPRSKSAKARSPRNAPAIPAASGARAAKEPLTGSARRSKAPGAAPSAGRAKKESAVPPSGAAELTVPVEDKSIGTLWPLSKPVGHHAQPRIVCVEVGCVVVWDEEGAGAHAAFLSPTKNEVLWQQTLGEKSVRPTLALAPWGQAVVVWYENSRVLWATVSRDGVGSESLLTRVSGHQPFAAVIAGVEKGQWWVAFRDYEAGHFETFVLRAQCPDGPVLQ